jgi:hypothetical protein
MGAWLCRPASLQDVLAMFDKDGRVSHKKLHAARRMRPYVAEQSRRFADYLVLEGVPRDLQATVEVLMVLQFFFKDQEHVWEQHFARGLAYLYRCTWEKDTHRLLALATRAWAGMSPVNETSGRLVVVR